MRDEKKWGDKTGDKKKWGDEMRDKKKMKRQDQYEKKWGDETRDKKPIGRQDARQKNGETRCETGRRNTIQKEKVAQRHQMVSGSLALLFFLLGFHGGRQGSGPDKGGSPVEWRDFPSVRLSVRPSVPPSGPST